MGVHIIINMNNSPTDSYLLFSPLLKQRPSPILSPFPHLRKISDDLSDLMSFKLEAHHEQQFNQDYSQQQSSLHCQNLAGTDYALGLEDPEPKNEQIEEYVHSPVQLQRCEMPSTKFHEPKEEQQPPFLLLSSEDTALSIQSMIEFLVDHSGLKEDILFYEGKRFHELGPGVEEAFKILTAKFKKLKKTKQELTKYCMRKAFKFVSDQGKREGSGRGLEGSMRRYFAQEDDAESFSVPFKKNSAEKTMNGNFLKRVFGCPRFAADYQQFLNEFDDVVREDNNRKVAYLAKLIEQALAENNIGKIESMRRLPWTIQILRQTRGLAATLPQESNGRRIKKTE